MKPCNEPPFDLRLPASAAFTIADAAGVGIECRQGCVWITLDGDTRDFVLEPGQRFQHDGHRHAVVSAFEASRIVVSCARLVRSAPSATRQIWPWSVLGRRADIA